MLGLGLRQRYCFGSDCDDSDATVYTGATELCDGQDNDCDSSIPSDEVDQDNDNHVACTLDTGGWMAQVVS